MSDLKLREWKTLETFLNSKFYLPDTQAMLCLLGAYAAQFYLDEAPVWIFLLGESSTGKTEIGMRSLEFLPKVTSESDVSITSFISGFGSTGILQRLVDPKSPKRGNQITSNGVVVFSDYSVMLSKDRQEQADVTSALRRIYDRKYERALGNVGTVQWSGKLTVLAACTPVLERTWQENKDLGERFNIIRWQHGDPRQYRAFARNHIGKEGDIQKQFKRLVEIFVDRPSFKLVDLVIEPNMDEILYEVAMMTTMLQGTVMRDLKINTRPVLEVNQSHGCSRLYKSMLNLVRGLCTLFRLDSPDGFIYDCAFRMGIESIPVNRLKILKAMSVRDTPWELNELQRATKIPMTTYKRVIEDMKYLGIIDVNKIERDVEDDITMISIKRRFQQVMGFVERYKKLIKPFEEAANSANFDADYEDMVLG